MPKQALITGSDGFVGRHITKLLESKGWRTLGVDITSGNDAVKYFQRGTDRFDLIVHAAYTVGGRATIDGKNTALISNELLDASMFDWALRTKQKAVLYFSSSAAYPVHYQRQEGITISGTPGCHPDLYETMVDNAILKGDLGMPDAHYGWAKLNGERLASVAGENGLRVHVVRPFSGYAEDQSLDYPFPSIIRRAVAGDLSVWGPPGQTRDWVHILDVVEGAYAVYAADERRPVNLCTGRGVEMGELALMVCEERLRMGENLTFSPEVNYDESKPTGVFYRVGDPTRMNEHYTAKVTLEEGIKRALAKS